MVRINLLPWREKKKKYEERATRIIVLAAMIIAAIVVITAHFLMKQAVEKSHDQLTKLEEEWQLIMLEKQIITSDQDDHLPVETIQKINSYRSATKNLLAEMTKVKQKTVCFTEMTRVKNHIYFTGYARSAADFTEYLKTWPAARMFSEMTIETLQSDSPRQQMKFRFQAIEHHSF